jgi:anhydro-N-acetylmuramic acid kinase
MTDLYIGLMSGTSLDGVDAVLVDFDAPRESVVRVLAHAHQAFDSALARELLALNTPGENELHRAALAGNALARVYADLVDTVLDQGETMRKQVVAIGAHGQTVRHRPGEFDATGYTVQLNNPALLAELCGIDVVADLRSRDVAAGGQGAPLVPAFHRTVFGSGQPLAVVNIGGIANLTALRGDGTTLGFDCGPGNALMDLWCRRHTGLAYDDAGTWAASGRVHSALLSEMLADPYFAMPPPKSTGRDLFNAVWLNAMLLRCGSVPNAPADVQATLAELTAMACSRDVLRYANGALELLVCGGGAYNEHLMRRLAAHLPAMRIRSTAALGLPPDQVEACAFAWLARAFVRREFGSIAAVTGATGARILGALYPSG